MTRPRKLLLILKLTVPKSKLHRQVLDRVISASDVLICMFDAENPKRRDHVDFLAPYIRRFDGESLLAVLNRCDRLAEEELSSRILPEFSAHLAAAWDREVDTVFCTSARSHLNDPGWDPAATPRHAFDQFEDLRRQIFGAFNRAGFVVDRRLTNAAATSSRRWPTRGPIFTPRFTAGLPSAGSARWGG